MSEHVRIERNRGVLAITLARPERRNAITIPMYSALADAIGGARDDGETRVITLRGLGQDCAAGNDLADFLQAVPRDEEIPVWRLLRALAEAHAVDVVHLNAPAQAAGLDLSCPVIAVSHSCVVTWLYAVRAQTPTADWAWQLRRNRAGFDRVDAVVTPSRSHGDMLEACYGPGPWPATARLDLSGALH